MRSPQLSGNRRQQERPHSFDIFVCRLMRYVLLLLLFVFTGFLSVSQTTVKGIVADSITKQVLPFATIHPDGGQRATITNITGYFSIVIAPPASQVRVSYVGYADKIFTVGRLSVMDTVFLSPTGHTLGEVIIRPQADRIRRIVNTAIRNKSLHNPEMLERYQCHIYYKMKVDLTPSGMPVDSNLIKRRRAENDREDTVKKKSRADTTEFTLISDRNHILFSESLSKRLYKRPQQLQETVLASRFSGLKKTYFPSLVTDVLPFHVYSDYISLNGKDYLNPIAKGWQQRYDFQLYDEITDGSDTTFILAFSPKPKVSFNSLEGLVYINSNGYAISHFTGTTTDTASQRETRIEQVYTRNSGRWFPRELNYDLIFKRYPSPYFTMRMNGHSIIDSVSYAAFSNKLFNKAYPVKLSDSVDLYTETQWEQLRMDTITTRELRTYELLDSISKKHNLEKVMEIAGPLAIGRLPIGKIDIDIARLLAFNEYEGTRIGAGLYTNDNVSKYFSAGGWMGYGFRDKIVKYGGSLTIYPVKNKDHWFRFSYNKDFRNTGNITIHPEIDRSGFRNWILSQVDRISEYKLEAHTKRGYWEFTAEGMQQDLLSHADNSFQYRSNILRRFDRHETGIGLRYAYGEKRVPLFGYYFPSGTKYPIMYLRSAIGTISATGYLATYVRSVAALSFSKRINRWGLDQWQVEAGYTKVIDDKPLPRSFLLAAKGFKTEGLNYYAWGGFLTMRPYDLYADSYVSVLYKHDFDKHLWNLRFSKPYVSIAHNLLYGQLSRSSRLANPGIVAPASGYHESGIVLNQLLQKNLFNAAYLYVNAGAFYHWTPVFDWKRNGVFVIGISAGF